MLRFIYVYTYICIIKLTKRSCILIVFIVDLNLMPSVKFRAAMSESKSICGPLYIDFNSDWFALWFLRIKYVRKGNLLCLVVEFLDLVIFLHKGDFHIFRQVLEVDHRRRNCFTGYCSQYRLISTNVIFLIPSNSNTSVSYFWSNFEY